MEKPTQPHSQTLTDTASTAPVSTTGTRLAPAKSVLIKRQLMVVYSYLMIMAGVLLTQNMGIFTANAPIITLAITAMTINLVFLLVIASGWTQNRKDPFLLIPQILLAFSLLTVLMHYAEEMRGAMQSIYFLIMLFALFERSRSALAWLALAAFAFYIGLHVFELVTSPEKLVISMVIGNTILLLLGLSLLIYVGGHMNKLQLKITRQAQALRENQTHLENTNQQLEKTLAHIEELAIRDELTGLFNRRYFLERLQESLDRAERTAQPFHLALIDLDYFKKVNDAHGHHAGDIILKRFSDMARNLLRSSDVLARYGGEEFIILFQEGHLGDIKGIVERLRAGFASLDHDDIATDLHVTLSAGIAGWQPGDTAHSLTHRADTALYDAKESGRNQVIVSPQAA